MTRGWLAIENKRRYVDIAYAGSGASYTDPDGYGYQALQAYKEGTFTRLLEQVKRNFPEDNQEKITQIDKEWVDYSYVLKGDKLFVYYYDKLLFSVSPQTVDFWLYFASNEEAFVNTYGYKADTLQYSPYVQTVKAINKAAKSVDYDAAKVELCHDPVWLLWAMSKDVWYREDRKAYVTHLRQSDSSDSIRLILSQCDWDRRKYEWYVQLPWVRKQILEKASSKRAAIKMLGEAARDNRAGLLRYAEIYKTITAEKQAGKNHSYSEALQRYQDAYREKPWAFANECSPEKIAEYIAR